MFVFHSAVGVRTARLSPDIGLSCCRRLDDWTSAYRGAGQGKVSTPELNGLVSVSMGRLYQVLTWRRRPGEVTTPAAPSAQPRFSSQALLGQAGPDLAGSERP